MSTTCDQARQEAFGQRMLDLLNHAGLALMISVGHRTGLFDALAGRDFATTDEIAAQTGLNERYMREWLGAMVAGGVVELEATGKHYRLPDEHAAWLTRASSPNNVAASTQWIAVLGAVEGHVVEAFRHGRGVPYAAYPRFHEVMAEESAQTVVAGLVDHILPLVPSLAERLAAGIHVLDIGCGSGQAMCFLAERFPSSQFAGYDFSNQAIQAAAATAKDRGLKNVRFETRDVAALNETAAFELITAFDAIHDQARPEAVLQSIARALAPRGVFLMQDIMGSSHIHEDLNLPLATFGYAVSCLHCMSVSLAEGGPGLGAMWGKERALAMLAEAGFNQVSVETTEHDILNYYYIARRV